MKTNGDFPASPVGTRVPRIDGAEKVAGEARFGADVVLKGMLTGRILQSSYSHAIIKKIDTHRAPYPA